MRSRLLLFCSLLGLTCLMAACGNYSPANEVIPANPSSSATPLTTLKELERELNAGEVEAALTLFSAEAELVEIQPGYLAVDETGIGYQRQLAYDTQVSYKGQAWIKAYLFALVHDKFESNDSTYSSSADTVSWLTRAQLYNASLEIEFKATVTGGQIQWLVVTNKNLVNTQP